MEESTKYNGWTNHATWRINLEILSDMEWDEPTSAEELQDLVQEIVFEDSDINTLQSGYAQAFLSDVNFYEIANNINEDLKEDNPGSGLVDALIMLASNE